MTSVNDLIDRYFEASGRHDTEEVVRLFSPQAVVVDDGKPYRGTALIRDWRNGAASEYKYTTKVTERVWSSESEVLVTARLEGNFPGGTADLHFSFEMAGSLISRLTIAP